jgi:hypothetical protein
MPAGSNTEVERWFKEPCLPRKSSPEELKAYMQSKVYDFPIVIQIAGILQLSLQLQLPLSGSLVKLEV